MLALLAQAAATPAADPVAAYASVGGTYGVAAALAALAWNFPKLAGAVAGVLNTLREERREAAQAQAAQMAAFQLALDGVSRSAREERDRDRERIDERHAETTERLGEVAASLSQVTHNLLELRAMVDRRQQRRDAGESPSGVLRRGPAAEVPQ